MKVLVIGASGFIGYRVSGFLSHNHTTFGTFFQNADIRIAHCQLEKLDVRDKDAVLDVFRKLTPDVAVLVCGTQSVEKCAGLEGQRHQQEAWDVHLIGTTNVAEACREYSCRLTYVSTDCVFDGKSTLCPEQHMPNPFNEYGRMKRRGEEIIERSGMVNWVIIRASLIFGWTVHERQFRNYAIRVLDALKETDQPVTAATNLFNTPIYITPAAWAVSKIAIGKEVGIFHVASHDRISRYKFAVMLAEIFGFRKARICPVKDYSGLRPLNSCLSAEKAEAVLGARFGGLREGLIQMSKNDDQQPWMLR